MKKATDRLLMFCIFVILGNVPHQVEREVTTVSSPSIDDNIALLSVGDGR